MASLSLRSRAELTQVALLPTTADDGAVALAVAQQFPRAGAFVPGDSLVVASSQAFHVVAGDGSVLASTASPRFAAGVYKLTVPDGCSHVSMVDSADAAGIGQAYKG